MGWPGETIDNYKCIKLCVVENRDRELTWMIHRVVVVW